MNNKHPQRRFPMYGLLPYVSPDQYYSDPDWQYEGELISYDGLDEWDIIRYADGSYAYTYLIRTEDN